MSAHVVFVYYYERILDSYILVVNNAITKNAYVSLISSQYTHSSKKVIVINIDKKVNIPCGIYSEEGIFLLNDEADNVIDSISEL